MLGNSSNIALFIGIALHLLTIFLICQYAETSFEFTNIKCESVDKSFADFEYCYIKAVNRTYKYFSLKVKLFKPPITNVTVKAQLMKKTNSYKPFLLDVTFDGCKIQRERNNYLFEYLYSFVKYHTNLNHTCPFDHDLIVDKLDIGFIKNRVTELLPKLEGDYGLFTYWSVNNKIRARVKIFITLN